MSQTKGLFRLNALLDISFDSWNQMEVDFLFVAGKVVIELDGAQNHSRFLKNDIQCTYQIESTAATIRSNFISRIPYAKFNWHKEKT